MDCRPWLRLKHLNFESCVQNLLVEITVWKDLIQTTQSNHKENSVAGCILYYCKRNNKEAEACIKTVAHNIE